MQLRQLKFFLFHLFSIFFLKHCATLGSRVSNFSILTTDVCGWSQQAVLCSLYGCFGSSEIAGPSGSSLNSIAMPHFNNMSIILISLAYTAIYLCIFQKLCISICIIYIYIYVIHHFSPFMAPDKWRH